VARPLTIVHHKRASPSMHHQPPPPPPHPPTLPAGYLVSAGHSVDLWDVNTAQKLCTLASAGGDDEGDELEALGGLEGLEGMLGSGPPFTCVSYSGSLLAAGGWLLLVLPLVVGAGGDVCRCQCMRCVQVRDADPGCYNTHSHVC
jgi:hypothetical protein